MIFKLLDARGEIHKIQGEEDILHITRSGFAGTAEVVDANDVTLSGFDNVVVDPGDIDSMRELLLDLIADLPVGCEREMASMVYTTGNCDILAMALAELHPEGKIVGVVDMFDEDGSVIEGPAYLVHAGLLIGDMVIDITGVSPREKWLATWLDVGGVDAYLEMLEEGYLKALRPHGADGHIDDARTVASLLSFVTGVPSPAYHLAQSNLAMT